VILLKAPRDVSVDQVHASAKGIDRYLGDHLLDIVPAYDSIAVFTDLAITEATKLLDRQVVEGADQENKNAIKTLPICYELGLDWDHVTVHTGLAKDEVIARHLEGTYRSLFMGFMPGFIYADGLDERMACPRKANPRTQVPAGSVGIGGSQTGIYSLQAPGGWNIIGRTPEQLFKIDKTPPNEFEVGERFCFKRINENEFWQWGS